MFFLIHHHQYLLVLIFISQNIMDVKFLASRNSQLHQNRHLFQYDANAIYDLFDEAIVFINLFSFHLYFFKLFYFIGVILQDNANIYHLNNQGYFKRIDISSLIFGDDFYIDSQFCFLDNLTFIQIFAKSFLNFFVKTEADDFLKTANIQYSLHETNAHFSDFLNLLEYLKFCEICSILFSREQHVYFYKFILAHGIALNLYIFQQVRCFESRFGYVCVCCILIDYAL